MTIARRPHARDILLDRSLEQLPLFRLSDTVEDPAVSYTTEEGGRWRVLASPGERLPGTFDQDVYVELMRRFTEAGEPSDGVLTFTLHAFLRSMNRQVDGRTYEQLRGSLTRLCKRERRAESPASSDSWARTKCRSKRCKASRCAARSGTKISAA